MLTLHKATKEGFYYKKYSLCFLNPHTASFQIPRVWQIHIKLCLAFLLNISGSRLTVSSSEAKKAIHFKFNKSTLAQNSPPAS